MKKLICWIFGHRAPAYLFDEGAPFSIRVAHCARCEAKCEFWRGTL